MRTYGALGQDGSARAITYSVAQFCTDSTDSAERTCQHCRAPHPQARSTVPPMHPSSHDRRHLCACLAQCENVRVFLVREDLYQPQLQVGRYPT